MLSTFCLFAAALAELSGPQSLKELTGMVYPNGGSPEYQPLKHFPQVAVAPNGTLQVTDLFVSHYPLKKGHITFGLHHMLTEDVPEGSSIDIVSYVGNNLLFNGTLPLCDYLTFAKLECPLRAQKQPEISKHVLRVPAEAGDGRLSFVASAKTPEGVSIVDLAGIVDLVNDGTEATEETFHDEL